MLRRFLSVITVAALAASVMLLTSCSAGNREYPVTIGNITIKDEPESAVVLSDSLADVLISVGYAQKLIARSEECTQTELGILPTVGTADAPDIDKIIALKPDILLAESKLPGDSAKKLADADITVILMDSADNRDQLETLYANLSAALGGNVSGREKGIKAVRDNLVTLDELERLVPSDNSPKKKACYLYMQDDKLCAFTGDTFSDKLFEYIHTDNVAHGFTNGNIETDALKLSKVEYIFCPEGQAEQIKSLPELQELPAVTGGKLYEMPMLLMTRQGDSIALAVQFLIGKLYPEVNTGGNPVTVPPTTTENDIKDLSADYGITITDDMVLKYEDESDDVKAMQKRLYDLGYLSVEPTGMYYDLTIQALNDFQLKNNFNATESADAELLRYLFSSEAIESGDQSE